MEEKAKKLYEEAVLKLKEANFELCRPEEDVVAQLVCSNAQSAISNYLRGFLLENGIESSSKDSIDSLYEQCKIINDHFSEVHLTGFECNAHKDESRFCNESTRFSRCFDIADSLDTFLRREKIIS
ncbi:HEPN domain-containing protein [Maribacter sp. TH_r10]|uniref:HEPN domain-containing protein n=1 Tax=Maribacter luteus TaxID=2594478 RepID=A0A6I2MJS4_9FLAO|nr:MULTISPECIES: HEPN domain-containing protein [Maribacter]MDV7138030.1 HEPN domain-containing protein [Maribacter sp. TH_r10]MRX62809.1 HEPN domain-containing protein [Maribacter luteus]|tara:strand:- start:528 stop:905 length:378 start_codon:yes stop_codon:yes gene_type:complete